MGYVFMVAGCYVCGKLFSFNPMKVPSMRDKSGVRQAVCRKCVESANEMRREKGLEPFSIADGAYEPCDESEIEL
jgi:hypothetical protein